MLSPDRIKRRNNEGEFEGGSSDLELEGGNTSAIDLYQMQEQKHLHFRKFKFRSAWELYMGSKRRDNMMFGKIERKLNQNLDVLYILRNNLVTNCFHDMVLGDRTKSLLNFNCKNILSHELQDQDCVLDEWYMEEQCSRAFMNESKSNNKKRMEESDGMRILEGQLRSSTEHASGKRKGNKLGEFLEDEIEKLVNQNLLRGLPKEFRNKIQNDLFAEDQIMQNYMTQSIKKLNKRKTKREMKANARKSELEVNNQDDPWAKQKSQKDASKAINKPKVLKQSTDDKFNNFLDNEIKDLGLDMEQALEDADSSTVAQTNKTKKERTNDNKSGEETQVPTQ